MAMVRSEEDMSLKNPVTPPGIDPGTVRLVAQRLNHYATPGPSNLPVPVLVILVLRSDSLASWTSSTCCNNVNKDFVSTDIVTKYRGFD
jgi:hypothetical protein